MVSTLLSFLVFTLLIYSAQAGHGMPFCTQPLWVEGQEYCEGKSVQHKGAEYRAIWCTSIEPGTGIEYDGWDSLGSCTPTSPTPTPSTSPTTDPTPDPTTEPTGSPVPTPDPGSPLVIGYFANWKIYYNFYLKNLVTSGSAPLLTHIVYAFGGVNADGTCYLTDPEADTDKIFTSSISVDGSDDASDQPLRGNFNQILQLKRKYPHIKVLFSVGGWTLSGNFGAASRNADVFANSCYDLIFDELYQAADGTPVFDGLDIDWEYPNDCGETCDASGPDAYARLLAAVRNRFGSKLVTSAITGDGSSQGKIDSTDYAEGAKHLDFMMVMTYDYFGAWDQYGPTAPHAPLFAYDGIPNSEMYADKAIQKLKTAGIPSSKLLFGIPFYGRGWTGVTQVAPGGSATGPAAGIENGFQNYNVLKNTCNTVQYIAGTAYSLCGSDWWGFDDAKSIGFKTAYAADEELGGVFTWELSGDTEDGELMKSMAHTARSHFSRGGMRKARSVSSRGGRCSASNNRYRA